mmetsp:Transcript_15340/g.26647  ORF Transcript_15340/g.26647 Transcript_15340/m.26647 type:complete len:131 (-) Transcript_15340:1570-1962(-)
MYSDMLRYRSSYKLRVNSSVGKRTRFRSGNRGKENLCSMSKMTGVVLAFSAPVEPKDGLAPDEDEVYTFVTHRKGLTPNASEFQVSVSRIENGTLHVSRVRSSKHQFCLGQILTTSWYVHLVQMLRLFYH